MGRYRPLWLGALGLAVVGGVVWLLLAATVPDPRYQGKPLSTWLEQAFNFSRGQGVTKMEYTAAAAAAAIRAIGTNGLPLLLNWAVAEDSPLKRKLIDLAYGQSFVKFKRQPPEERREMARYGFSVLGPSAAPAVPALVDLLNHNGDPGIRTDLAEALGYIGPAAADAIPDLIRSVKGTNRLVAARASLALARIHSKPEMVVPALVQNLERTRRGSDEFTFTIVAIGQFGGQATDAVPALLALLKEDDDETRALAAQTLKEIDPEAAAKARVK